MAKLSVNVVKRPKRHVFDEVFTDPSNTDLVLPMSFRKLSAMEWLAVQDMGNKRAIQFVHGTGEVGKPGYSPPDNLPPVDGEPVFLTDSSCTVIAGLEYAQVADEENRYTFEEIAGFMTVDVICRQMTAAFEKLESSVEDGETTGPLATTTG